MPDNDNAKDWDSKVATYAAVWSRITHRFPGAMPPDELPPWRPRLWNLHTNLRLFLRIFSWRVLLIPVSGRPLSEYWQGETPGSYLRANVRELYVFGVRVARWVVDGETLDDPRYKQRAEALEALAAKVDVNIEVSTEEKS